MKYYLGLNIDAEMEDQIALAIRAENAGFDGIWSTHYYNSPFIPLAAIARETKSIGLGTNIAYAFTRSPMETALSALDLDSLSNGRFTLGLAPAFRTINERWYGVPHGRPAPHMKECIQVTRAVIEEVSRGKPVRFKGDYYDVDIDGWHRSQKMPRDRIPIYVGAMQEGMCRMAGDVADGLMPHSICSPSWIKEVMLPNVNKGLTRSGRKREDFDFCACISVAITNDRRQGIHDYKDTIAFSAVTRLYQPIFDWHGFGKEAANIRDIFLNKGYCPEVIEAVPDEMVEAFAVVGSVDEVRRRVGEYGEFVDSIQFAQNSYGSGIDIEHYMDAVFDTYAR